MRHLVVGALLLAMGCSKCSDKASADGGTPPAADALAPLAADASVAAPRDAGSEPSEAELLLAYAKDCAFSVQKSYYQHDEDKRGDECVAVNLDQSCAPDTFGCCGKSEDCKKQCGADCQSCAAGCAEICKALRIVCERKPTTDRAGCAPAAAKARLECRGSCLAARARCLSDACPAQETACDNDGESRRKKSCPDCAELGQCMWEEGFKDDHEKCLTRYPENAKDCLVWCFQE